MNPLRDPKFTLRMEPALKRLATLENSSAKSIAMISRVDLADLQRWLGEFNGGREKLTLARIEEVKREVGVLTKTATASAPRVPVAVKLAPTSDVSKWLVSQGAKVGAIINTYQVEVTPALATAWLKFNAGNRSPSKAKIRRFAAAMKTHKWELNGETVKFSISGRLIDGQSRLMAVIDAGIAIPLEVRAGLPDRAQESMDCGELRKGTHTLEMLGEKNAGILSPALKLVWLQDRGWLAQKPFGVSAVMENGEVKTLLDKHNELKSSVGWAVSTGAKIKILMPLSEAAFFHYIFGAINSGHRDPFFESLVDGVGLTKASAVYHLREALLTDRTAAKKMAKIERHALIIKAWNHVMRGEQTSQLRYITRGPNAEKFPAIEKIAA